MPTSYNLRSLQRKQSTENARNCYLQNFSENSSPQAFNPKVCLERLKFLEHHDIQNSRFYFKKGRITVKQNKSILFNRKDLLKFFFTLAVLIVSFIYWKDYMQTNEVSLAKRYQENIHLFIQNYYNVAIDFHNKIFKKQETKEEKSDSKNEKKISQDSDGNSTLMDENFLIRQLVRDYFVEIRKKNKIKNLLKSPQSFIEEQCKRDLEDEFYPKQKKTFYNVTFQDQENLVDFALESQGAKIVTVYNTELYGTITVKYFNIQLWPELENFLMKYLKYFSSNGPNSILVPWKKPGDCWAFKGSHGRVQIKLSKEIVVSAVTVEHIPEEIAPKGSNQSAPRKFSLLGVAGYGSEINRTYLGSYEYKIPGSAAQTFFVQSRVRRVFGNVEIVFHSNHGNELYTCIYKIRIHG